MPALLLIYRKFKWMDNSKEMRDLAEAAGYDIVAELEFRKLHKENYLSNTRYEELDYLITEHQITHILVNEPVSLRYMRKIEEHFDSDEISVIDKAMLTLEIFSKRASSPEIQAQIQLAQLKYTVPRTRQIVGESLRTEKQARERGAGQTAKEIMQSDARRRKSLMEKRLDDLKEKPDDNEFRIIPRIPILGFYSVGKSTLFNILTDTDRETGDEAFTTMFMKTSWSRVTGYPIQLVDTIGLVDLPPKVVESFSLMLNSIFASNLIIICLDCSIPQQDFNTQLDAVLSYYDRFAEKTKDYRIIFALTKCDLINAEMYEEYKEIVEKKAEDDVRCISYEITGVRMDRSQYVKNAFAKLVDIMLDEELYEFVLEDVNPADRSKIFDVARVIQEDWNEGKLNIRGMLPRASFDKHLKVLMDKES